MIHPDDQELLDQFRQPALKERAYTTLIRKYQERIYWHIRRLVVDHEDANDVMQNVFIKVWNGLDNFKENSQIYTWLYRIATNESISFLELQKRKRADYSLSDMEGALENKCGPIRALTHKSWNGNCSLPYKSCLKNNVSCLTSGISTKCLTRK